MEAAVLMLWLRRSSYNSKLLVLIMVISGITLVLAGMSFVVSDTLLFRRYVQRDLDGLSQIIATSSATALLAGDSDAARSALAGLRARPYVAEACLYYRTGDLLARYARDDLQGQCPDAIMADSQHSVGEDLQLFRTVTQNGQAVGHLFFDYRIGEAQAERRRVYIEWAAIIVALAASAALFLAFKLRLFLSKPLLELAETASSVSNSANYGIRATRRSTDEVGVLVDSFNGMLAAIQRRDAQLVAAHEELERRVSVRTAELRESERRFRLLVEEVRDYAIYMLDPLGFVTSWNAGAQRIKGYRADEAIGLHLSQFYPVEEKEKHTAENLLSSAAAEGRAEAEGWRIRKDGSRFWANVTITALHDPQGHLIGYSKITRDLTEKKRAEELLRQQAAELARSNAELQRFTSVASHDLQEPLRMVTTFMQLVSERCSGKLDAESNEFIGYAVDGALRMRQLVSDLLTYSRVSSNPEETEPVDFEQLLPEVLRDLDVMIQESDARITHDPMPTALAVRSQIIQLFQNLLTNAIKFSKPAPPQIHVSAQARGTEWTFSVRDQGIGIRAEHFDRIFIMFKRLHDRTQFAGTGIGLAICKRIVERHHGRIWVESTPGRGSTFFFTLPAMSPGRKETFHEYSQLGSN
jgi:PAS domain S-box-containing protein